MAANHVTRGLDQATASCDAPPMKVNVPLSETQQNGGVVTPLAGSGGWLMETPPLAGAYCNAQLDDYSQSRPSTFRWEPGTTLTMRARFSAGATELRGTAGFGFWNAPFGPGTGAALRLPQAVWFFYASPASNLPLAPGDDRGNGWFASTIDAATKRALKWAPFVVRVLALNQIRAMRRALWPIIQRSLNISFQRMALDMCAWHEYRIAWRPTGTLFAVDGQPLMATAALVQGSLGFVTWIDNQHMTVTPRGRLRWGVENLPKRQWLEVADIQLDRR